MTEAECQHWLQFQYEVVQAMTTADSQEVLVAACQGVFSHYLPGSLLQLELKQGKLNPAISRAEAGWSVVGAQVLSFPLLAAGQQLGVWQVTLVQAPPAAMLSILTLMAQAIAQALSGLQTRQQLQDERDYLQRVIEGGDLGTWDLNLNTWKMILSPRFLEILKLTPEQAPGSLRAWKALVHPVDYPVLSKLLHACRKQLTQGQFQCELRVLAGEGEWKWVRVKAGVSQRNQSLQALSISGILSDINHYKEAEQQWLSEEIHYKKIFDNMLDGYLLVVVDGPVLRFNRAAYDMFAYRPEDDLQALRVRDFFVDAEEYERIRQKLLSEGRVARERAQIRRRDGRIVWIEGSLQILRQPGTTNLLTEAIFRDVSQLMEAQQRLDLQAAQEAANLVKNEFLARMSHEIRTPLNALLGLTYLTLRTQLSDRQQDYLNKIELAGKHLLMLVNDILDFSKIEAGKLELENIEFKLSEILDQMSATHAGAASEKGLEFLIYVAPDVPLCLRGDPLRLGQVLNNLLSNAIKFCAHGSVSLSINRVQNSNDNKLHLHFLVRDTGIGMSLEQQMNLFLAFNQGDLSISRKYGGTGLGLAISQRLIGLMGGSIHVESQPDQGTGFAFTIIGEHSQLTAPCQAVLPELRGAKALVVEDHPEARGVLSALLTSLGMRVTQARDGAEAQRKLRNRTQAAGWVFLEQALSGPLNAVDWLNWLQARPGGSDWRVVIISEQGREDLLVGENLLLKPVTRHHLHDLLQRLLRADYHPQASALQVVRDEAIRGHVLLVEDHPINQQVARELLQNLGLQVDVAEDGRQALQRLRSHSARYWDLILMDLEMPQMDGYTAAGLIRQQTEFARLPIIAMTAHVLQEERERCLQAGMDDFIPKPIDPISLKSVLSRYLKKELSLSTSELSVEPPDIAGVDVRAGLARLAGNLKAYKRILRDFAAQQAGWIIQAKQALREENTKALHMLVHTLKGAAGNIGAENMYARARELEGLIRSCEPQQLEQPFNELISALLELTNTIQSVLGEETETGVIRDCSLVELKHKLEILTAQLSVSDGEALDSWYQLLPRLNGLVPAKIISQIGETLQLLDFDQALELLPQLLLYLQEVRT